QRNRLRDRIPVAHALQPRVQERRGRIADELSNPPAEGSMKPGPGRSRPTPNSASRNTSMASGQQSHPGSKAPGLPQTRPPDVFAVPAPARFGMLTAMKDYARMSKAELI